MQEVLHASAVAFDGRAVVLTGASGTGKSSLAIALVALGGVLVSDDRVIADEKNGAVWLTAPSSLQGIIEARQFGLLSVPFETARAALVVDMGRIETSRLPEWNVTTIVGIELPMIRKVESPTFPAMLKLYFSEGLAE